MVLTPGDLSLEIGANEHRATRLLSVAAAAVEAYAPAAPEVLKDEAVIRFAGYLANSDFGGFRSESFEAIGTHEYTTNHAAAFRNCGAAMLLTRFKVRRAGVVG